MATALLTERSHRDVIIRMKDGTRVSLKTIVFIALISFGFMACDAVLGPPGSGDDIPFPPPGTRPSLGRTYEHLLEGQPDQTAMRMRGGYYIWKKGDTWHVRISRTEGPPTMYGSTPAFTGRIFVQNGFFSRVDSQGITQRAFSEFQQTRNDIFFKVVPRERIEGFDFEVQPAGIKYCLTIDLQHNYGATPSLVHLGKSMLTPDTLPLNICYPY